MNLDLIIKDYFGELERRKVENEPIEIAAKELEKRAMGRKRRPLTYIPAGPWVRQLRVPGPWIQLDGSEDPGLPVLFQLEVDVAYGGDINDESTLMLIYDVEVGTTITFGDNPNPFSPSSFPPHPNPSQTNFGWYRLSHAHVIVNEAIDIAYGGDASIDAGDINQAISSGNIIFIYNVIGFIELNHWPYFELQFVIADPSPGKIKNVWFRTTAKSPTLPGPWIKCADEGETVTFDTQVDVAFGGDQAYDFGDIYDSLAYNSENNVTLVFLNNVTGPITFGGGSSSFEPLPNPNDLTRSGWFRTRSTL